MITPFRWPDLAERVRALLVRGDDAPRWSPADPAGVTDAPSEPLPAR